MIVDFLFKGSGFVMFVLLFLVVSNSSSGNLQVVFDDFCGVFDRLRSVL